MIVRVRHAAGTWRFTVESPASLVQDVLDAIKREHDVDAVLTSDPAGTHPIDPLKSLDDQGLGSNGAMVFTKTQVAPKGKRRIEDGSIVSQRYEDYTQSKGFRPGMSALRDMKKSWTLSDFLLMDEQYNFKIKRQEKTDATVSLDARSCQVFQSYVQQLGWRQMRVGILYGTFDQGAKVECIYEPPQTCDANSFEINDDGKGDMLASLLSLQRVGWIFAHPPREDGFLFSGAEILQAAQFQLEAADGVHETAFVSVKVYVNEQGEANFEAYQVSQQCMSMVAEGALGTDPEDLSACAVHPTFTAIVEGKQAASVNTNFFLCNVPVKQHESTKLRASFPKENRLIPQTRDDLKAVLAQKQDLMDFSLLLFLSSFPAIFDFLPSLIADPYNLDEGYRLILYSFAGLDV